MIFMRWKTFTLEVELSIEHKAEESWRKQSLLVHCQGVVKGNSGKNIYWTTQHEDDNNIEG